MNYDFNVSRNKNKIIIDIDNWIQPSDSLVQLQKISGKKNPTYITQVLSITNKDVPLKENDTIFLTRVGSEVAITPTSFYSIGKRRLFSLPYSQIIGKFLGTDISIGNLQLLNKHVLFKKVVIENSSLLGVFDSKATIGRVERAYENSSFKKDTIIIVKDNVSTQFFNSDVYAVDEKDIIATVQTTESNTELKLTSNYVLMKPYIKLNSSVLITPDINYDDLDYSDIYNRDLFKVIMSSDKSKVHENDIVMVNRDYTTYLYYNLEKYFVLDDEKWIKARIIERDKQWTT